MRRIRNACLVGTCCLMFAAEAALGGSSLALYGTYWDTKDPGYGAGLKYKLSLIDLVSVDGRGGYIRFDDGNDSGMVPLEVAFNLGLPGPISPYAGVGLGYYFTDIPSVDDASGYFGQVGLEFTIVKIGAMIELRYMDLEEDYLDELSLNAGLVWQF